MNERLRMVFRGRVQGVHFRATTRYIASRHDVSGWVRNLPDGSVEAVAEGPSPALDALLREVKIAKAECIDSVELVRETATGEFTGFTIIR